MTNPPEIIRGVVSAYENRQAPEGVRSLAQLYWRLLLFAALLLVVGSIGYGAWSLLNAITATNMAVPVTKPVPASIGIERSDLDSLVSAYVSRKVRFDDLSKNIVSISDPSVTSGKGTVSQ